MKAAVFIFLVVFVTSCTQKRTNDFVQGNIRIVPPVQRVGLGAVMEDGGTTMFTVKDAAGKSFDIYIDYRLGTKTPGAVYLIAYPGESGSVRVQNEKEFRQKVRFE